MIGAEHALHVGKRRLIELDRLLDTTGRSVGVREAAAGAERVGMLRPQDPHTVAEHLLMERDRLSRSAGRLVAVREVALGTERVGIVKSQDSRTLVQYSLIH